MSDHDPLISYLDLEEKESNRFEHQLGMIWNYLGEQTKSELASERLDSLRQLENRLSPPKIGESRVGRLTQYIKSRQVVADAEKWHNRSS